MQEISNTEALGKVVREIVCSQHNGQMVITFDNNTFTTFGVDRGWEPGDEEICENRLSMDSFGNEALVALGILTAEEIEKRRKMRLAHQNRTQRARDLAAYKRLKAKFE